MKKRLSTPLILLALACTFLNWGCEPQAQEKKTTPELATETEAQKGTGLTEQTKESWPICNQACTYGDEVVPLDQAANWTATYRNTFPGAPRAFFFSLNSVISLLDYCQDCDGIRMYFATDPNAEVESGPNAYVYAMRMVLVGVKDSTDQLPTGAMSTLGCSFDYTNNLGESSVLNGGETTQDINSYDGFLSTNAAASVTAAWQQGQQDEGRTLAAYTFCMDYMCGVLSQGENDAAIGMRFYIGLDPEAEPGQQFRMVMVGVDGLGNDLAFEDEFGSEVVDFAAPCPQYCGQPSPLNENL